MKFSVQLILASSLLVSSSALASAAPAFNYQPKSPKKVDQPIGFRNDYLVIAPVELALSAQHLKKYRETFGHRVKVVLLSEIGRGSVTAEQIDGWIERHHRNNRNLKYVALLGDASRLPGFSVHLEIHDTTVTSDLPYGVTGTVTELNHIPSLMVGRIPIRSPLEFDSYLSKIRLFDQTFKLRRKVLFFGHPPELDYAMNRDVQLVRELGYEPVLLSEPSEEDLFRKINDPGIAAVLYYSHGSWYGNVPLTQENANKIKNFRMPFLYFSGGCGFGDAPPGERSLSEFLLLGTTGSAASIGANQNGGYGFEYSFVPGALGALRASRTLGELFLSGLRAQRDAAIAERGGAAEGPAYSLYFTYRMSLVGDPALRIH